MHFQAQAAIVRIVFISRNHAMILFQLKMLWDANGFQLVEH